MKKDLTKVCNYLKTLVIPHTPENFVVAERFRYGLTDDEIRKGLAAFREFLHMFFDKMAEDEIDIDTGGKWDADTLPNLRECFLTVFDLIMTLFTLGIRGRLEKSPVLKLTVYTNDLFTTICPKTEPYLSFIKMKSEHKVKMFRFLSDLGLRFIGADFSCEVDFSAIESFQVTSEINEYFVIGLKLISEATLNNTHYYYIMNLFQPAFLRCDFHPLANTVPKKHKVNIKDLLIAEKPEIREWVMGINDWLINAGCRVTHTIVAERFSYTLKKVGNMKGRICKIHIGNKGCFVSPGINHLHNPGSILNSLPDDVMDLIRNAKKCKTCSKNNYERCPHSGTVNFTHDGEEIVRCWTAEYKIPLNNVANRKLIEKWLEMELAVHH